MMQKGLTSVDFKDFVCRGGNEDLSQRFSNASGLPSSFQDNITQCTPSNPFQPQKCTYFKQTENDHPIVPEAATIYPLYYSSTWWKVGVLYHPFWEKGV